MRALSVRQPWCWAIIHGEKRIENRTWPTKYTGPLVIHASANTKDYLALTLDSWRRQIPDLPEFRDDYIQTHFGCLYGLVDVIGCFPLYKLPPSLRGNRYAEGPYCWVLDNPRPIEHVPYKGRTLMFDVPVDIIKPRGAQPCD
jgi:hypothetical protein